MVLDVKEDVGIGIVEMFLNLFLVIDGDLNVIGSWEGFFWDEFEV